MKFQGTAHAQQSITGEHGRRGARHVVPWRCCYGGYMGRDDRRHVGNRWKPENEELPCIAVENVLQ